MKKKNRRGKEEKEKEEKEKVIRRLEEKFSQIQREKKGEIWTLEDQEEMIRTIDKCVKTIKKKKATRGDEIKIL